MPLFAPPRIVSFHPPFPPWWFPITSPLSSSFRGLCIPTIPSPPLHAHRLLAPKLTHFTAPAGDISLLRRIRMFLTSVSYQRIVYLVSDCLPRLLQGNTSRKVRRPMPLAPQPSNTTCTTHMLLICTPICYEWQCSHWANTGRFLLVCFRYAEGTNCGLFLDLLTKVSKETVIFPLVWMSITYTTHIRRTLIPNPGIYTQHRHWTTGTLNRYFKNQNHCQENTFWCIFSRINLEIALWECFNRPSNLIISAASQWMIPL